MTTYYSTLYDRICQVNKVRCEQYAKGSGLHQHHIIPRHMGGTDDIENLTYLTVREHIIAHYLLWKIHNNPNDLRSMHMLGANLSTYQRRITGIYCRDNNIGIFGASKQELYDWRKKGIETQKQRQVGIHDPVMKPKYNSYAGHISGTKQAQLGLGFHQPHIRAKAQSLGGKSLKGMICVTNGSHRTRIKPDLLQSYLDKGYRKGFTLLP